MKKLIAGIVAATALLVSPAAAFANGRHGRSAELASCALTGSTAGAPLDMSGSGYTPGASYGVVFNWSNGSATGIGTAADSSGNLNVAETAYYSGVVTVNVQSGTKTVASCSLTIG